MRKFYYSNVPDLGNVAVSRHALLRMDSENISESEFEKVLLEGEIMPEGHAVTWRELNGVRIVIVNKPEPFKGAKLVKTVFRIQGQKVVKIDGR